MFIELELLNLSLKPECHAYLQAKLEEASREFYHGILSSLRAKSLSPVYVKMDLDLWRYVSFNRGAESQHAGYGLYQIEDFSRFDKLPQNWWYFFEQGW